jgi:RNA-directed DNA polymerase
VEKVADGTTTIYTFSASKVIAEYVNGVAPSSAFYPIVNDETLLKEFDGWLLNSVHRALRLRAKLLRKAGVAIPPPPHDLPKSELLKFAYRPRPGEFVDLRFPSIARVARLIRRASTTYGASAIANPQSHSYYAG